MKAFDAGGEHFPDITNIGRQSKTKHTSYQTKFEKDGGEMPESDHTSPTRFKHNYDGVDMDEGRLQLPKRITVTNPEGRAWFARGWLHLLNFNHEEALACLKHCIHVDDACVMALWGIGELHFLLTAFFEDEAQY